MSSAKLFVLCGVDGCGKSTLVDLVSKRLQEIGHHSTVLKKDIKTNVNLICDFWGGDQDWSGGKFAQLVSIATGMDFISHYDKHIQTLMKGNTIVICDRYSYCYTSYMSSVNTDKDYFSMFDNIKTPDKTFYIKVPPEVAIERHHLRGGPSDDETPDVIRKFSDSYDDLFSGMPDVVTVDNTQKLEHSVSEIVEHILEAL